MAYANEAARGGRVDRRIWRAAIVGAAALFCQPYGFPADDFPEPWLEEAAFSIAPSKMLAAAEAHPVPTGAGAIELFEEHSYRYDDVGRHSSRHLVIYRILTKEA